MYNIVRNSPVAKFYYKGSHSHPIRRTILVISTTSKHIIGYEIREGSTTRLLKDAPVKTYLKSNIATLDKLGACKHRRPGPNITSLKRSKLLEVIAEGA